MGEATQGVSILWTAEAGRVKSNLKREIERFKFFISVKKSFRMNEDIGYSYWLLLED